MHATIKIAQDKLQEKTTLKDEQATIISRIPNPMPHIGGFGNAVAVTQPNTPPMKIPTAWFLHSLNPSSKVRDMTEIEANAGKIDSSPNKDVINKDMITASAVFTVRKPRRNFGRGKIWPPFYRLDERIDEMFPKSYNSWERSVVNA